MKKLFFIIISVALISGCKNETIKRNCNKVNGGTLRIAFQEKCISLFPSSLNNILAFNIANLIHTGLVYYNAETMEVLPYLSKKWTVDSNYSKYTFYINTNAYFNDDKCFSGLADRKITAKDVYFSYKLLCTRSENNYYYDILFNEIEGVDVFEKNNFKGEISGIKIINDSTIVFKLKKPNPLFIYSIASPVFSIIPEKAYNVYKHSISIGGGPFYIKKFEDKSSPFVLVKNENFFLNDKQNNCLPFLDTIIIYTNVPINTQLEMLKNGKLDVILNIDDETLIEFMEKNIMLFEGENPPYKVLSANLTNANFPYKYIISSKVENFFINQQNLLSLLTTKIKKR
ncbi:MAG: ABC transporter substrate-binding protein [Bacteroidales bacterium]|nr:ABC transporter substrate-binding protein [Bacteroidales bacterium]